MFDITSWAAQAAKTSGRPEISAPGTLPPAARTAGRGARRPIDPHGVSRWACGEGLGAGDAVALLVRDLGQAEALRLGLVRIGVRVACLEPSACGAALAGALAASGAALAVVDAALAEAYGTVMGRLVDYPLVWWNGPGADFASLDRALAELT